MSRETKWTPGEWWVRECTTNGVDGFEICHSPDEECVTDHVYERGDAHLIAAAPENYRSNAELNAIVRELCDNYGHPYPQASLDSSDAALAKARGETE